MEVEQEETKEVVSFRGLVNQPDFDLLKKIKRVHILALHGWTFLTSSAIKKSEKYAKIAAESLREDFELFGQKDVQIEYSALSGTGKTQNVPKNKCTIKERAMVCLEELSAEEKEKISKADLVLFVAHSQGAPVSVILTSFMFDNSILSRSQRIGILTMAGAHHGTFEEMGKYMQEATEELHAIADPDSSTFNQLYAPAMRKILTFGVTLICVASFADKIISLSSALADGLNHPNIFRALYVNGAYYKPSFMLELSLFAIQRRNEGHFDDIARFARTPHSVSTTLMNSINQVIQSGSSVMASGTRELMMSRIQKAGLILKSTREVLTEGHSSHSKIHDCKDVYKFGLETLISHTPEQLPILQVRPKKDQPSPEEWESFIKHLIELESTTETNKQIITSLRDLFFFEELQGLELELKKRLEEIHFGLTEARKDDLKKMRNAVGSAMEDIVLISHLRKALGDVELALESIMLD